MVPKKPGKSPDVRPDGQERHVLVLIEFKDIVLEI